jgi:hypothetical protein
VESILAGRGQHCIDGCSSRVCDWPFVEIIPLFHDHYPNRAHAEHAGGAAVDPPAAAGHGAGRPRGLLFRPAAQAPRDRHPGEHRPGVLVFEPAARHPLIAVSGGRGAGVSGAGAGARLDDRHVGRRPPLAASE